MKDLIDRILAYLPQYMTDFGALIAAPRRFISERDLTSQAAFEQALLFLGISLALVVVMTVPLLPPGHDMWTYAGTTALLALLTVALGAVVLRLAWRLVGGTAEIRSFFLIYAYFFGAILIGFTLFRLIGIGVLKVFEPEIFAKLTEANLKRTPIPDFTGNTVARAAYTVLGVGQLILFGWGIFAWGAYRDLNGLSQPRSIAAFLLTMLLGSVAAAALFFIAAAMQR